MESRTSSLTPPKSSAHSMLSQDKSLELDEPPLKPGDLEEILLQLRDGQGSIQDSLARLHDELRQVLNRRHSRLTPRSKAHSLEMFEETYYAMLDGRKKGMTAAGIGARSASKGSKKSGPVDKAPNILAQEVSEDDDFLDLDARVGREMMKKAQESWKNDGLGRTKLATSSSVPKPSAVLPGIGDDSSARVSLHVPSGPAAIMMSGERSGERTPRRKVDSAAQETSQVSLTALFKSREADLMPGGAASVTAKASGRISPIEDSIRKDAPTHCLMVCWLCAVSFWTRISAVAPWGQCESSLAQRLCKAYHFLMISSNLAIAVWLCTQQQNFLATPLAISVGSLLAVWSTGGWDFYERAEKHIEIFGYLTNYMQAAGLTLRWRRLRSWDAFAASIIWLGVIGFRAYFCIVFDTTSVLHLLFYGITSATLLGLCCLQTCLWRGHALMVVSFAQGLFTGGWTPHEARSCWREVISCMRCTSRLYQSSFSMIFFAIVLVLMGALFDFQQGQAKEAAPSLVLAAALLFSPYVAASATAHCTRLPSLISMLDGDEEEEEQYINLAHFLLICESGFFMWDTRVTLGVLQKFVYFSIAIVSTIAFQLGVFHF